MDGYDSDVTEQSDDELVDLTQPIEIPDSPTKVAFQTLQNWLPCFTGKGKFLCGMPDHHHDNETTWPRESYQHLKNVFFKPVEERTEAEFMHRSYVREMNRVYKILKRLGLLDNDDVKEIFQTAPPKTETTKSLVGSTARQMEGVYYWKHNSIHHFQYVGKVSLTSTNNLWVRTYNHLDHSWGNRVECEALSVALHLTSNTDWKISKIDTEQNGSYQYLSDNSDLEAFSILVLGSLWPNGLNQELKFRYHDVLFHSVAEFVSWKIAKRGVSLPFLPLPQLVVEDGV
eukprot:TRINITY_DN12585_c0_g1_i1.p1 TRINITY_DN12585_c0_g1~~TRINITY_DN12585_c0_g1_i1.p1  ORF type:complete len:286 (-),score=44.34 TRINITY_DN12585_c0_g1_i1:53-910(-)